MLNKEQNEIRLIKFEASWCMPCKKMVPVIEKLKEEFKNIKFESKDVDTEYQLAQEYKVQSVPLFVLIKDNKEVARSIGMSSKEELSTFIKSNM